jgi:GxxExxY protein
LINHEGHEEHEGMEFDTLSNQVIGCAIEVHRELGPGLLESTYEQCLAHELALSGIQFERQKQLPVEYKGQLIDCGYRIDLLVADQLILELKCVDKFSPIHQAQLMTYMKLAKIKTGILVNFNVTLLKNGLKRIVL